MFRNNQSSLFSLLIIFLINEAYANDSSDLIDLSNIDHNDFIALNNEKPESIASQNLVSFDSALLFGNSTQVDLSRFQIENYITPGDYFVTTSVNDRELGSFDVKFEHLDGSSSAVLCIDAELLAKLDLKPELLEKLSQKKCLVIQDIDENAYYVFDKSILKLNIYIPQLYVIERPRGYIDPKRFNNGVTSGFIGYNFNYNKDDFSESKYLSLSSGFNTFGWYFRHAGYFSSSDSGLGSYQASYNALYKDITQINSRLALGQFTTQSRDLDNISVIGAQISSDVDMLPLSQRNSSPVIENIAYTNALIKIYQNGRMIYEKNVPAGPFKISDLATYSDGNLILEINETGGEQRTFTIPFFNNVNVLKKGRLDYSFSVGRYYLQQKMTDDYVIQNNINYGISNHVTGLLGLNASQDFQSIFLGGAFNTKFGGFNFNTETQKSNIENNSLTGSRITFSHKYSWPRSKFNISSDYTYYDKQYISFSNHLYLKNYRKDFVENLNFDYTFNLKNSYGIYFSKSFDHINLGSLRAGYRTSEYWNRSESFDQYTLAYSHGYKKLSYSLSATQTAYSNRAKKDDFNVYLSLSIPLDWKSKKIFINNSVQHSSQNYQTTSATRISGTLGSNNSLSFGLGIQNNLHGTQNRDDSINGYANYRMSKATLSSTFNHSENNKQYSLSADGAIVAHPFGLSLVNFVPTTYTIIHAQGAKGADVENAWGVKVDRFGNAIYPHNMPYQENIISLNPENLPGNVNFSSNQIKIVPRRYSAQLAIFDTQKTSNILLNISSSKMDRLPIGSQLFDDKNNEVGILGPTQQILLDHENALDNPMKLVWGNGVNESCIIEPISKMVLKNQSKQEFRVMNVECQ